MTSCWTARSSRRRSATNALSRLAGSTAAEAGPEIGDIAIGVGGDLALQSLTCFRVRPSGSASAVGSDRLSTESAGASKPA
jgi:hypothetical protein